MPQQSLIPTAFAQESESTEAQIVRIATDVGIPTTTLFNLAYSESTLGENRTGDKGKSCGIIHFNKDYYPLENSRCGNDEYILTRAAEMIRDGLAWRFTPCSCIQYAKALGVNIPKGYSAWDLLPNSKPVVGGLVLINGNHTAVISGFSKDGSSVIVQEANWKPCLLSTRAIPVNSRIIRGFWDG